MQEPPERPKHNDSIDLSTEIIQAWMNTSESCPEGTIPIRETTEQDVLRASSVRRFGRKIRRRDTTSSDHEVHSLLNSDIKHTILCRLYNSTVNFAKWTFQSFSMNYIFLNSILMQKLSIIFLETNLFIWRFLIRLQISEGHFW